MKARVAVALSLAYVVLFGASLYFWQSESHAPGPPELKTPGQSNYYVKNPVAYRFNENGHLIYRMSATQSLHFPDDSIDITAPNMRYFDESPGQWHITARRGHVPPGAERIRLRDRVRARHTAPERGTTRVKTSRAWVYPEAERVTSKAYVVADEPKQRVAGDGMKLNLKTNELKVLNNANVTYKK